MRVIECPYGHRLEAATDEEIRQRVKDDAYDA